jgi:two-component system nitrate/nitrite sensor histidine kinase NarX
MEDLLAYERTLLRTLIDTLQQPIFIKDTQSRYVLSNLAYAHLVGETPETILNHTDADYFPSDLALLYNTDDQAVMRTGQAKLNYEEPVVDVQGRSLWFAFSKTPLYDREGKIVGIVGAGFDITDRKRIQEAEREQRALAEAFRDTAAALSSTLDYEKVLDLVLAGIPRVVPAEAASIALVEAGGVRFVRQYGRDEASFSVLSLAPTPIEKIANLHTMYHTRQPLIIYDVHHYDGWVQLKDFSEVHSHLGCPILLEESVIGFINLYNHEPNFFTPEHAERLQSFANQAAVAIQNARQYQHAHEVAMVAERQRLARELHDAVSQTLFSASIIAETLPRLWERNPDDVLVGLKELQRLTRGALAEMRNLLLELRPRAVLETDMSTLLRHLADAVTGHTQVPVKLEIVGQGLLPEEAQLAFYRVAQEALNNTIKHARAKEIGVKFVNQPDQIDLMIHDNGRGFDPKKPLTEQFGLKIMQERAEAIGAQLFIQSQPGVGTAIRLTWLQEKD